MSTAFLTALLAASRPVIMEVKRHDGDGADLFGGRTVAEIVAAYEQLRPPCLSVVTGAWFGGTGDLLRQVRERTSLPLLQKDFLRRPADLDRAVDLGASAVLLTVRLLPANRLAKLVDGALDRGLTPFVEVTSGRELRALPRAAECVVAVNNKDIGARESGPADLGRSAALLDAVRATGSRCPVSASGIGDPEIAGRLLRSGYAGLLIGAGLLRSRDLRSWTARLDAARTPG